MFKKIWAWLTKPFRKKQVAFVPEPTITTPFPEPDSPNFISFKLMAESDNSDDLERVTCELKWILSQTSIAGSGQLELRHKDGGINVFSLAESDVLILLQFLKFPIKTFFDGTKLIMKVDLGKI